MSLTSGHPFAQEAPVAANGRAARHPYFGRARLPNYECVFATSVTYPDLPCARPISPPSRGPALSLPPACKRNVGIFNPASQWVMTRRGTSGSARGSALLRDRFKIILSVVNMAERSEASPPLVRHRESYGGQCRDPPFVSNESQS